MRVGERIEVVSSWSTFKGKRGRVTQTSPYLAVVLDDDPRPMRVGEREIVALGSERHVGGAE